MTPGERLGPPAPPTAVLWDMDGTLVDTEPYWFASERDLVEEFGHEWPDHHAHAVVGFDLLDAAAYIQEHGHVSLPREEIVERLLYSLVNVGANILDEGIAQRASDIDVIYAFGYGFPRYRGGPMFYADSVGLKKIYERIHEFGRKLDAQYWKPAPLLEKLALAGSSFAAWQAGRAA